MSVAIRREYIYLTSIARTLWLLRLVKPNATSSIVDIVERQARKRPGNIAIYYLDQRMSYAELDARANRYAHWALAQGIGRGSVVALLMENRPDYICAWLGLFKAGAQVALINTNLSGAALSHSISISGARHAIVGAELEENFSAAPFEERPVLWIEGLPSVSVGNAAVQEPVRGESGERSVATAYGRAKTPRDHWSNDAGRSRIGRGPRRRSLAKGSHGDGLGFPLFAGHCHAGVQP